MDKDLIDVSDENIEIINEGLVEIQVPVFDKVSSKAPVFYNSKMELNRDISILALQTFQKEINREINICDVFGGSGVRALRYKKEIDSVGEVTANDISPLAIEYILANALTNELDIEIHQKEANILLREHRGEFDVIDIDPFGTPSYFVDSVGYSLKKDSLLCITATDTSALCGTYIEPCIRKYNAKSYKSEYCHENGIRILAGFVALTLAKYKKHIEIKLSHSSLHYMRLYIKVNKGSAATDKSLNENMGHIAHCKKCLYRQSFRGLSTFIFEKCPICEEKLAIAGPLWIGKIQNHDFIAKMIENCQDKKHLNTEKQIFKLLKLCLEEANAPITFYDIHVICKNLKISAPKLENVLDNLKKKGFIAIKTHFNPIGIKTDAGIENVKLIVKSSS
ncbi:MAG: tRNA (guanine(26)-N(2))-dimethyltransferase [Methanobacteriaceae archaeon]|jgi:tRNA (guanine26-N2/guanine27-N2)-dimethyltransferase|nr:tRNA (guanine(26)-N(2))-dimethyltransferase [Candidatus Methanorudis spinitermitis]